MASQSYDGAFGADSCACAALGEEEGDGAVREGRTERP